MMNEDAEYKKFQDEKASNQTGPGWFSPPPSYAPPQSIQMDKQMVDNYHRTKRLAIVEVILSCLLLLFGMVSIGLGASLYWYTPNVGICNLGTSIWAPAIGIITAGLGLGALKYGNYNRKCLLVSHFVMCIISAIASGILVIFTSVCLAEFPLILKSTRYGDGGCTYRWCILPGMPEAMLAFEVFILIGALAHMIASIVSTAFICSYWCGGKGNSATTILYIPNTTGNGNGPMQTITVPAGAQVVFVPSNGTIGQGAATLSIPYM